MMKEELREKIEQLREELNSKIEGRQDLAKQQALSEELDTLIAQYMEA